MPSADLNAVARVQRADPVSYSPLSNPAAPDRHGFSPPSPAASSAPTEDELRETLAQAITSRNFAAENVDRAHATHERAVRHVAHCRERLAEFAGLDGEITDATVKALRSGEGRPRIDDNDPLRRRVVERDIAKADLRAAEHALQVLFDALTDAQADAGAATKAANTAAATLSMMLAEQMAERVVALETEAQQLREELHGADVVGVTPPPALKTIYGDGARFLRPVDRSAWAALRERLLADPHAALELV